ncbi:hypothetical protein DSO57_1034526 [Entomophthora muscae]|uniref:Uncharacterized protein n=1 Tax=Entomophthora muscae TaxID=34485 RepID=A0ACC2S210_9FUNG|nr:hypothetical protein DSO57_1034526 [Entomophthora muscae]
MLRPRKSIRKPFPSHDIFNLSSTLQMHTVFLRGIPSLKVSSSQNGWLFRIETLVLRKYSYASQAEPIGDVDLVEQESESVCPKDSTEKSRESLLNSKRTQVRYSIFDGIASLPPHFNASVNWGQTRTYEKIEFTFISNQRLKHGLPTGKDLALLYNFSKKLRVLDRPDYWDDLSGIIEADLFEYLSPVQLRTVFYFWLYKRVNPKQLENFFTFIDLMISTNQPFDLLDYNKVLWYLTRDHAFTYAQRMVPILWEKMEANGFTPDRASYDLAVTSFMLSRDYSRAGIFADRMVSFGYPPSEALVKAISNIPYQYMKESFDSAPESQLRTFSILLSWHDSSK